MPIGLCVGGGCWFAVLRYPIQPGFQARNSSIPDISLFSLTSSPQAGPAHSLRTCVPLLPTRTLESRPLFAPVPASSLLTQLISPAVSSLHSHGLIFWTLAQRLPWGSLPRGPSSNQVSLGRSYSPFPFVLGGPITPTYVSKLWVNMSLRFTSILPPPSTPGTTPRSALVITQ